MSNWHWEKTKCQYTGAEAMIAAHINRRVSTESRLAVRRQINTRVKPRHNISNDTHAQNAALGGSKANGTNISMRNGGFVATGISTEYRKPSRSYSGFIGVP